MTRHTVCGGGVGHTSIEELVLLEERPSVPLLLVPLLMGRRANTPLQLRMYGGGLELRGLGGGRQVHDRVGVLGLDGPEGLAEDII